MKLKINEKELEFISWSKKSLSAGGEIEEEIQDLRWDDKFIYVNKNKLNSLNVLQIRCISCNEGLYNINISRFKQFLKRKDKPPFVCRSCSIKENKKKQDWEHYKKVRKEIWKNKSIEEKKKFSEKVSKSKTSSYNITQEKIEEFIHSYQNGIPMYRAKEIIGGSQALAKKILENNNIKRRGFREAQQLYLKNNPLENPFRKKEVKEKIKEWRKNNPINFDGKPSQEEIDFYEKLKGSKQWQVWLNGKQFDFLLDNNYIEFDGVYWHGKEVNNYTIVQMKSLLNDEEKHQIIINKKLNLYRIWSDEVFEEYTLEEIRDKAYLIIENGKKIKDVRKFSPNIISKHYAKNLVLKYPEEIDYNFSIIQDFIQTFYPFPYIESDETLESVVKKIKNKTGGELTSTTRIGNDYLKSHFHSYFKASKGRKSSMYDAYYGDELLDIIKNRLGITYKESWDLTPEVIRRGFISNYYAVSFFNPYNAYKIYKKIASPGETVLDMSSGFGSRLLGWYSFQSNGKYIGYEPNKQTYKELVKFSKKLHSNIEIYNKPFEEGEKHLVDVCFSCPPYFDTEIYSLEKNQSIEKHSEFGEWVGWLKDCINKMKQMTDRVYLVLNEKIYQSLNRGEMILKIKNQGSHFTSKKINYEYLIKF